MLKVTIAVVSSSGILGKSVLEAIDSGLFDDKIQFPVKALSRTEELSTDKVEYIKTEIDDESLPFIVESLNGIDVIIELITPLPDLLKILERIVERVQPRLYIPSQFGVDLSQVETYSPGFLSIKRKHAYAIKNPKIKVVDVVTSLFAQEGGFLYEYVGAVGIDTQTKTVIQRGDPLTKFSITKLRDIGFSLISLATLPTSKLPDVVRISSDTITFQDVIDKYEKNHLVKLTTVKTLTKEESLHELQSSFTKEYNFSDYDFNMGDFLRYVNGIVSQGVDKGASFTEIHNELVNPNQSLWTWGKY